jgi:hypothetical protein
MPADPLADLNTESNKLSAWLIEDDLSNLERVSVALAAGRDRIDDFDYALFDQRLLKELNIDMLDTRGTTPDAEANSWHRDLVHLSAERLGELARAIWVHGQTDRRLKKQMAEAVTGAVKTGRLDRARMKEKVLSQIGA